MILTPPRPASPVRMVRRVPPRDLSDIDGLTAWLRSTLGVVRDASGNVSEWRDQSGRGNHAVQATAGARPTYAQDANGRWVVQSAATPRYMTIPQTTDTDATARGLTVYFVGSSVSASANAYACGKWDSGVAANCSWTIGLNNGSASSAGVFVSEVGTNTLRGVALGDASTGAPHVIALRYNAGVRASLDGTAAGPTAIAGYKTPSTAMSVGAFSFNGAGAGAIDIYEIAVIQRYISFDSADDVFIRDCFRRTAGTP